jgi:DNA-binding PadR family transcriptional regulator
MARTDISQKDEMGAHARLYDQIANGPAWLALSFSARALYMQLRVKLKHTNNGNIEATLGTLKHSGFKSSSTLAKALRELETVGLIAKTRQGGITAGGRLCNLYRFTDKPMHEFPKQRLSAGKASHEWRQWHGVREAEAAVRAAHAAAKRPASEITSKAQDSNRINSEGEASSAKVSSKAGASRNGSVRNLKLGLVSGSHASG